MKLILWFWFIQHFLNHFPIYIYITTVTTNIAVGRAYSMNRLDQLAQPIRRNGEHVRSILERERREQELEMLDETSSLASGSTRRGYVAGGRGKRAGGSASANNSGTSTAVGAMSRSMTHLAGGGAARGGGGGGKYSLGGGISSSFRPLGSVGQRDSSKSMTQISYTWSQFGGTPNNNTKSSYNGYNSNSNNSPHTKQEQRQSNLGLQTSATKKYLLSSSFSASFSTLSANATRRAQQQYATATNPQFYRYLDHDPNSLLLMNSSSLLVNAGVCDNNNNTTKNNNI